MKKILIIGIILLTTNLTANNILKSWNCGNILVSLCENNKMCVGGLTYDIEYKNNYIYLIYDNTPMLMIKGKLSDIITIINVDNKKDKKTFIICN